MTTPLIPPSATAGVPAPNKIARGPYSPLRIDVLGPIGVGKSSFCMECEQLASHSYPEEIPSYLLVPFTDLQSIRPVMRPSQPGYVLQTSALVLAVHRDTQAWKEQDAKKERCLSAPIFNSVAERPPYENLVFALANHRLGNLTNDQFLDYYRYMAAAMKVAVAPPESAVQRIAMYLWAPVEVCKTRIQKRGRQGEDSYTTEYLDILAHESFMLILYSWGCIDASQLLPQIVVHQVLSASGHTEGVLDPLQNVPKIHVVDWSEFGKATPEGIFSAAQDEVVLRYPRHGEEMSALHSQITLFSAITNVSARIPFTGFALDPYLQCYASGADPDAWKKGAVARDMAMAAVASGSQLVIMEGNM